MRFSNNPVDHLFWVGLPATPISGTTEDAKSWTQASTSDGSYVENSDGNLFDQKPKMKTTSFLNLMHGLRVAL
jgi:hypothetical protein